VQVPAFAQLSARTLPALRTLRSRVKFICTRLDPVFSQEQLLERQAESPTPPPPPFQRTLICPPPPVQNQNAAQPRQPLPFKLTVEKVPAFPLLILVQMLSFQAPTGVMSPSMFREYRFPPFFQILFAFFLSANATQLRDGKASTPAALRPWTARCARSSPQDVSRFFLSFLPKRSPSRETRI